jgi:hypothetical protein
MPRYIRTADHANPNHNSPRPSAPAPRPIPALTSGRSRLRSFPKPDSGHADTTSTTFRLRWASWNAMKPRFQCVLTHWMSGFRTSGSAD